MAGDYDHIIRHKVEFSCHRKTFVLCGKLSNVPIS